MKKQPTILSLDIAMHNPRSFAVTSQHLPKDISIARRKSTIGSSRILPTNIMTANGGAEATAGVGKAPAKCNEIYYLGRTKEI